MRRDSLVPGQRRHDGFKEGLGLDSGGLRRDSPYGMGRYGHGQFRHSQRPPLYVTQPLKEMAADCDGGNAPSFQFHCVVDTPRGAGPSIAQSDDGHLHPGGQLLNNLRLGRNGGGGLAPVQRFRDLVLLP